MNPLPSSYASSNYVQRRDAERLLAKYSNIIQWRFDGHESLLDIGCGAGDVTNDILWPRMPKKFGKLVGVDKSTEMVNYAKREYERDNVSFDVLDIESDESVKLFLLNHPENFDHVTSFYTLHWIRNQPRGMQNIYKLLKPGGDCLFIIPVHHALPDIYKELAKIPKWNAFMPSIYDYFATFLNADHPGEYLIDVLRQTGFSNCNMDIVDKEMVYTGLDSIKANMTVVNPIWSKLTQQERDDYWRDHLDVAAQLNFYFDAANDEKCKLIIPYKLAIVYANK